MILYSRGNQMGINSGQTNQVKQRQRFNIIRIIISRFRRKRSWANNLSETARNDGQKSACDKENWKILEDEVPVKWPTLHRIVFKINY